MISSKIQFEVCDNSPSVVAISYVSVCFYLNPREKKLEMAKSKPTQRIFCVALVSTEAMETKLHSPWHSLKDIERNWKALLVCEPPGYCFLKWWPGQRAGFWWPTLSIFCASCKSTCLGYGRRPRTRLYNQIKLQILYSLICPFWVPKPWVSILSSVE